jgi:hypothetical protein
MADSTYLKNVVEPFIVQWVSQRIGVGKAGRASCLPVGTACAGYSPLAQTGWKHCPTLLASISGHQRSKIFATLCVLGVSALKMNLGPPGRPILKSALQSGSETGWKHCSTLSAVISG